MKYLAIFLSLFSLLLVVCGDSGTKSTECGPMSDDSKLIEIFNPTNGTVLTAGESIDIKWKVKSTIGKVDVKISFDDGLEFKDIFDNSISVPTSDQNVICMDATWKAGEPRGTQKITQTSTVLLMVQKYGDGSVNDIVEITIKK